jgi:hypothetical protein
MQRFLRAVSFREGEQAAYEKRGTLNGVAIDGRGAISTQFIRTPDGWRMSSMAWDDERPGLELPSRYPAR